MQARCFKSLFAFFSLAFVLATTALAQVPPQPGAPPWHRSLKAGARTAAMEDGAPTRMTERFAPVPFMNSMATPLAPTTSLPMDGAWEGWIAPATSGIPKVLEYHGKLVLCGQLDAVAHIAVGNIATWDGTRFEALPAVSSVYAQTIWDDRIVVATFANSSTGYVILSLNGAAWDTLGAVNGQVYAMATFQGRLVVVGKFTAVNGSPMNKIASFDGAAWTAFGSGLPSTVFQAEAVVDHAGTLVVAGLTTLSAGIVLRWDEGTSTWQALGAGLDREVDALATDGVNLFAAGIFTHSGVTPMAGNARWDGTTWNAMGTANVFFYHPVTVWNGKAVFVAPSGPSWLQTWDGSGLSTIPGDSLGYNVGLISSGLRVTTLATWGKRLVVTGKLFRNGSTPVPGIAIYDSTGWSTIGEPWDDSMRSPVGLGITDMREWGGKLVMTGQFGLIADRSQYRTMPGIAAYDGEHWSALGAGIIGSYAVLGEYQGDLVVASYRLSVRDATPIISNIARWNGTSWSGFGTGTGTSTPYSSYALQQFRNDLYDADEFGLLRWNGSSWSQVPGSDYGYMYALGTTSDSLLVGGDFITAVTTPNVAFWDGTNWLPAGAGVNAAVYAIANWSGRIVIGGYFTASGATPLAGVAIWDGAAWQPLGSNVVGVFVLRVIDGGLFALGDFRLPDNSIVRTVAHYIGPDWEPLGSGTNGYTFGAIGGYLYEGGSGIVNGHLSHGLSRAPLGAFLDAPRPEPRTLSVALTATPNPATSHVTLAYSLPQGGHVRLAVFDAGGRLVTRLVDGEVTAGRHQAVWSTRAAPGLYFASLDAPGGARRVTRIVRLE